MAKNDKGTWVGKTMQPTFQTYPTAGMIQPAASSSTAPSSTPATNAPPPPSNIIPPLTPTLPIGNITIGEGGGYPIIGDIILPNSSYDFTSVTAPPIDYTQPIAPQPEISTGREMLVNAVMRRTGGGGGSGRAGNLK